MDIMQANMRLVPGEQIEKIQDDMRHLRAENEGLRTEIRLAYKLIDEMTDERSELLDEIEQLKSKG